jgi:ribonucleoside-triphosphate reductase (thioredoxin)
LPAEQLPVVAPEFKSVKGPVRVVDTREGFADALRQLILSLYKGVVPPLDTSLVRPAGAPVKMFGGRASGPEALHRLHSFTIELFRAAAGRKLTPLECHDLVCNIAGVVDVYVGAPAI